MVFSNAKPYQRFITFALVISAVSCLEMAVSAFSIADHLVRLAETAKNNGDRHVAVTLLKYATEAAQEVSESTRLPADTQVDPPSQGLWLIAREYILLGHMKEAFDVAQSMYLTSQSIEYLRLLAKQFKEAGEQQMALELLNKASRVSGDAEPSSSSRLALASGFILRGERDKALVAMAHVEKMAEERGLVNSVEASALYRDIAEQYFWMSETSKAYQNLRRALEFVPHLSQDWAKAIQLGLIGLSLAKYVGLPVDDEGRNILVRIVSEQAGMKDFGTYQAFGECIRGTC